MDLTRRQMLRMGGLALVAVAVGACGRGDRIGAVAADSEFEVTLSEAEWRQRLTSEQFNVLRREATESPYSSPLNDEHRAGIFRCAGCDLELFASATKFDSNTGWPSFWEPLPDAVGTRTDNSLGMRRTEVHCRQCGGHLGHIFDDGPPPTGERWCINGLSLRFEPA